MALLAQICQSMLREVCNGSNSDNIFTKYLLSNNTTNTPKHVFLHYVSTSNPLCDAQYWLDWPVGCGFFPSLFIKYAYLKVDVCMYVVLLAHGEGEQKWPPF